MRTDGRLRDALRVSWSASWRQASFAFFLIAPPMFCLALALSAAALPAEMIAPLPGAAVLLPMSLWAHEAGHALAAACCAEASEPFRLDGEGTWWRSTVWRPYFGDARDAIVCLAGPCAGTAMMLPLALCSPIPFAVAPWLLPFLAHLAALSPARSDGAGLLLALRRARSCPKEPPAPCCTSIASSSPTAPSPFCTR